MAGFIFSLGSDNNKNIMKELVKKGCYSTNISSPKNNKWSSQMLATLGDYTTMRTGDNIYFFSKRKIYGIGTLISIKGDCKYCNYPAASNPILYDYYEINEEMLLNESEQCLENRWICFFKPDPYFFELGIDMDEALSYKPEAFKSLRVFWKKSFIKIDDEENNALKELFYLKNEENIQNKKHILEFNTFFHQQCTNKINYNYELNLSPILKNYAQDDRITNEMAIEISLLSYLDKNKDSIFGSWDYLTHQVCASPFKPIDYMEKIDIFGYRNVLNSTAISKFLIIEIKKDNATIETLNQISKYVDWTSSNKAYGDYSRIESFIVAYDFNEEVIQNYKEICERTYTFGNHPTITKKWNNLQLIQYRFEDGQIKFTRIN